MKKLVVITVLIIASLLSYSISAQTKQQKRQINLLEQEIKRTQGEIENIREGMKLSENQDKYWAEIDRHKAKIDLLKKERDNIFLSYAAGSDVPKEMRQRELKLRQQGNIARRDELVLNKLENNLSAVDPGTNKAGYKIILANDFPLPIAFVISPLDGGETTTVLIEPKKKEIIYLISGRYSVSTYNGDKQSGAPRLLNVNGNTHIFKGESCFGFAYMPRY